MNDNLKDAWKNSYKLGAAVSRRVLKHKENDAIIKKHFSSLTAENSMKLGPIHPHENKWDWKETDFIADYARANNLAMRGHTFI